MTRKDDSAWFLGIDLGTGSCKVVVVDEQGQILGFGAGQYASADADVEMQWKEQNPESILDGMSQTVRRAIANSGVKPRNCASISIGGALHSLIAVDQSGKPLTGVLTWADNRAHGQAETAKRSANTNSLYMQTGCPAHAMYPLYKIIWLREERPDIFQKTARFVSAKEYVMERFTGEYVVDYSLASGTGLLNTRTLSWNPDSLAMAEVKTKHLSILADPRETLSLRPKFASEMGIPPQTPLVIGSSDAANSNLGAGAVRASVATCMIGTSGAFRIIASEPMLDAHSRTWCYCIDESHWLVGGAINNGGVALSWLRDTLNRRYADLEEEGRKLTFESLMALAQQVGPGAEGLLCLPFFAGERSPNWNANARAIVFGLTLQHDIRHITRALLEGIAFRVRSVQEAFSQLTERLSEVRASGGFTHSDLWLQIVSDVLEQELSIPSWGETSSLGAAFWAMLGSGALASLEQVEEYVGIDRTTSPNQNSAKLYDTVYAIYKGLYQAMLPYLDDVASLEADLHDPTWL
jgi:gluconokinase